MNPSYKLGKHIPTEENKVILLSDFNKYMTLRELEGLSDSWYNQCKLYLEKYLEYVDWKIDENKTLEYYKKLKKYL